MLSFNTSQSISTFACKSLQEVHNQFSLKSAVLVVVGFILFVQPLPGNSTQKFATTHSHSSSSYCTFTYRSMQPFDNEEVYKKCTINSNKTAVVIDEVSYCLVDRKRTYAHAAVIIDYCCYCYLVLFVSHEY
jgi:hypothetical protein